MMMLKKLFLLCIVSSGLVCSEKLSANQVLLEAKAAYFRPSSNKFREIYSDGGIYGLESSFQAHKGFYPWISANYFHKSGSSIGEKNSTTINFVPLGAGLKYIFKVNSEDQLYIGAGILATYAHFKDNSDFVIRHTSNWGKGAIAKIGALINMRRFFIDIFSDYSWSKVHFHNQRSGGIIGHKADLSGFSIGAGLGYRFGNPAQSKRKSNSSS